MYENVVVGADDSNTAREAVRQAARLAALCGARLHIVTAQKPRVLQGPAVPEEFRYSLTGDEADGLLATLALDARSAGAEVVTHVRTKDAADSILEVASEVDADLIVVGNKGMQGPRRVLGSIPNSVLHQAPCAVLMVKTT